MEVILLEKIKGLGNVGDFVAVKNGYARNYLIPNNKVLKATEANKKRFEDERSKIEAENANKKEEALRVLEKIEGKNFVIVRQAAEDGRLYGSVSNKDIVNQLNSLFSIDVLFTNVELSSKIKELGVYSVTVNLHPDVQCVMEFSVARSEKEGLNVLSDKKE